MNKIELLAPAGSMDALRAAVENGADAVYLGGTRFSARQKAENFAPDAMAEAVRYAHAHGCKVHAAVNTLVRNDEIGALAEYAYRLAEAEVDALIVQDLGVFQLLRTALPQMAFHASTQMSVQNLPGVQFLEETGFSRVVLARETPLETVRAIRAASGIELEVFAHGALCLCYSGQCLFSSMLGGRSGNRGLCAQPCRLRYQLTDGAGRVCPSADGPYLLSTRDLNLLEHLPELIGAGVTALKIEGRMKRPEYVATVVHHYRQAIDACYGAARPDRREAAREILQIFNRDFTTGYTFGNPGAELMRHARPDNGGVLVARVTGTRPGGVWARLLTPLSAGDGYLARNAAGEELAGTISALRVDGKAVETARAGDLAWIALRGDVRGVREIYRTSDLHLLQRAAASYSRPSEPAKRTVHFAAVLRLGAPLSLTAWDEDGHVEQAESTYVVEAARTQPSTAARVRSQLDRLGGTEFALGEVAVDLDEGVIAPASELNRLRRTVLEGLRAQLAAERQAPAEAYEVYLERAGELLDRIPPQVSDYGLKQRLAVTVGTAAAVRAAAENGADIVYLQSTPLRGGARVDTASYRALAEDCHARGASICWTAGPIAAEQELPLLCSRMEAARDAGFDGVAAGSLGLLALARQAGWVSIVADYPLNLWNDLALQYLSELEIGRAVLSPELSLEQIAAFSYLGNLPLEILVHGNLPLMLSEHCVVGAVLGGRTSAERCSMPCQKGQYYLKDRKEVRFPLYMDEHCRMHLFNSRTLDLYDRLDACLETGVDVLRIEARERPAEWVGAVTAVYRAALDAYGQTGRFVADPVTSARLKRLSPEGTTYGQYFRGVL